MVVVYVVQFYDHFIEWGLKEEIRNLIAIRSRNGINAGSTVNIIASDADLYVAKIDDAIFMKIGPRYDVGNLVPSDFHVATSGQDYAVWEKK
jgi:alpha-amylase